MRYAFECVSWFEVVPTSKSSGKGKRKAGSVNTSVSTIAQKEASRNWAVSAGLAQPRKKRKATAGDVGAGK